MRPAASGAAPMSDLHSLSRAALVQRPRPNTLGQPEPLPSQSAARRLVEGELSAVPEVIGTMAVRGAIIGAGLAVAGEKGLKPIATKALVASAFVEVFVLLWEWAHK